MPACLAAAGLRAAGVFVQETKDRRLVKLREFAEFLNQPKSLFRVLRVNHKVSDAVENHAMDGAALRPSTRPSSCIASAVIAAKSYRH